MLMKILQIFKIPYTWAKFDYTNNHFPLQLETTTQQKQQQNHSWLGVHDKYTQFATSWFTSLISEEEHNHRTFLHYEKIKYITKQQNSSKTTTLSHLTSNLNFQKITLSRSVSKSNLLAQNRMHIHTYALAYSCAKQLFEIKDYPQIQKKTTTTTWVSK